MKILSADKAEEIQRAVQAEIEEAVRFAEESPEPELSELLEDVYA